MAKDETNWLEKAESDAWDMAENFLEDMIDQWCESGEISDDIKKDYSDGDAYHHETHTDKSYDLSEAAELLEQLGYYKETDEGLWEGLKPRDAISAQAAYTYGNAVLVKFRDLVGELNGHLDDLFGSVDWEAAEEERREDWAASEGDDADPDDYDGPDADDLKHTSVKSWLECYMRLRCWHGTEHKSGMVPGVLAKLEAGDWTGVLALADWMHEQGDTNEEATLRAMSR